MDYKIENDKEREYFNQNFDVMTELLQRIRNSLISGKPIKTNDLNLQGILDYKPSTTILYISLFQEGQDFIKYGSVRKELNAALNRDIEKLREHKRFSQFEVENTDKCRIMIEFSTHRLQTTLRRLQQSEFNEDRFEIGINGLELKKDGVSYYYMPTDGFTLSHLGLKQALNGVIRKTSIGKMTNKIPERIAILKETPGCEYFLLKSHAFITYKNEAIPLYRGNILYPEFSYDILLDQFINSCDWLVENMYDDGRFLYYYDCKEDNFVDHEHPTRKEDNLYYNDLRHCGGIITLLHAYNLTKNEKYLHAAKKAIDYCVSITQKHEFEKKPAYYSFLNNKAKLGGTGLFAASMMKYRITTGDTSYDDYIEGYINHILSRMTKSGELLGYYIHPQYNNGKPLLKVNDKDRKEMFSFYYPGEALLGLALFCNHYDKNKKFVDDVRKRARKALNWIVDERPKYYKELFTALPSDAWLMQAIEEWCEDESFRKENLINFVFQDANTLMEKMYSQNDTPYIDYDGGYFYEHGDHYFPDGARSEGLIASYYLAKKLGKEELATKILSACKRAAKSQFSLYVNNKNNYAHKNPQRSRRTIRFKATRQWVRVDSIQHVACFFIRLYKTEN